MQSTARRPLRRRASLPCHPIEDSPSTLYRSSVIAMVRLHEWMTNKINQIDTDEAA